MPVPVWSAPKGIAAVLDRWRQDDERAPGFAARWELSACPAALAEWPPDLAPALTTALAARGVERPYAHQRTAIDAARAGKHVVVATPTASGKSLCFHLPVLDAIAADREAKAIYLYPTKALSRDQESGLLDLVAKAGLPIGATVFDGDTPPDARRAARQSAAIVMTNPDMLHAGILPQHANWARTFAKLRYVVVDELHVYRGVFGSHVAHVLGRLRRIARFHGADPVFLCATATIGNPVEHASRLLGVSPEEIALVDQSTAPRGERHVFVYNPPVVNAELGIRASYAKSAVRLATELVRARVRTLVFGPSRNSVEIMLKYLRDEFRGEPSARDAIFAYRGGYLPETRRRVERGLREGDVLCVVATNALELGIDVGDLDAVVCASYPGSIAEMWQRFGRAGRRGEPSIALLVASSAPLDQYLAHRPDRLLSSDVEHARIDPSNTEVLIQHLKCAAFELPFQQGESYRPLGADDTSGALAFLEEHGVVHQSEGRYFWATDAFPANHVSLRNIGWENFVIVELETGRALAELDWHATPSMLHEQAIYQHDGEQYQVERLDYENHKAFVRKVAPDYFTTALRHRKVSLLDRSEERPLRSAVVGWGEVCVVEKVVGFKKVKFHTHENAGYGDVRLPDIDKHTTAFWLVVPAAARALLGESVVLLEGLRGVAHALELVATLALMCDPRDIGMSLSDDLGPPDGPSDGEEPPGAAAFDATAYLFDNVPGGVGLAERIYERADDLLDEVAALVGQCRCEAGCPSCVGVAAEAVGAAGADRELAAALGPAGRREAAARLLAALGFGRTP